MTPLTDTEIEEALKLSERATPGPWSAVPNYYCNTDRRATFCVQDEQDNHVHENEKDAVFIATSRTLVPRLATELKAAREKLARIQSIVDQQAKDEKLWGQVLYRVDAFHQEALRKLHEVIEGKSIRVGVGDDSRN